MSCSDRRAEDQGAAGTASWIVCHDTGWGQRVNSTILQDKMSRYWKRNQQLVCLTGCKKRKQKTCSTMKECVCTCVCACVYVWQEWQRGREICSRVAKRQGGLLKSGKEVGRSAQEWQRGREVCSRVAKRQGGLLKSGKEAGGSAQEWQRGREVCSRVAKRQGGLLNCGQQGSEANREMRTMMK